MPEIVTITYVRKQAETCDEACSKCTFFINGECAEPGELGEISGGCSDSKYWTIQSINTVD